MQDPLVAKVQGRLGLSFVWTGSLWIFYGLVQVVVLLLSSEKGSAQIAGAAVGGLLALCGLLTCLRLTWAAFAGTALAAVIFLFVLLSSLVMSDRLGSGAMGFVMLRTALPALAATAGFVLCMRWNDLRQMRRRVLVPVAATGDAGDAVEGIRFDCPHCEAALVAEQLETDDLAACPLCLKGFSGGAVLARGKRGRAAGPGIVCVQTTITAEQFFTEAVLRREWDVPSPQSEFAECPFCGHEVELGAASAKGRAGPHVLRDRSLRRVSYPTLVIIDRGATSCKRVTFRIAHQVESPQAASRPPVARVESEPAKRSAPRQRGAAASPSAEEAVVRFACPGCGKVVKAATSQAGKRVKCPRSSCGCVIRVPGGERA